MEFTTKKEVLDYLRGKMIGFECKTSLLSRAKSSIRHEMQERLEVATNYKFEVDERSYDSRNFVFDISANVGDARYLVLRVQVSKSAYTYIDTYEYYPYGSKIPHTRTEHRKGYKVSKLDFYYENDAVISDLIVEQDERKREINERAEQARINGLKVLSDNGFESVKAFADYLEKIVPNLSESQCKELRNEVSFDVIRALRY